MNDDFQQVTSMKKNILFVNPDYHNSFFIRDGLRARGWKADIYRSESYPKHLLFKDDCLTDNGNNHSCPSFLNRLCSITRKTKFFFQHIFRYHYFIVYGSPYVYSFLPGRLQLWFEKRNRCFELSLLRLFGKKIVYEPSGCNEEALKSDYEHHCPGLCSNCGYAKGVCNDAQNSHRLALRNKYGAASISVIPLPFNKTEPCHPIRYKCLDLDLWKPDLAIPKEHQLPKTKRLRIMHSFVDNNRQNDGKNIKGSPSILQAINRLKSEGYPVEYFYAKDIPSKDMRFYQAQADIIVEQLIYGWWGSTGVETLSLGKPVVCYLNPEWKKRFFSLYPEYSELPIIEADTYNIYGVLKKLVENPSLRQKSGKAARAFAESHFDINKNVIEIEDLLLSL